MTDIPPDVEQALANMTEGEFAAFSARVRAPDTEEQLKAAVGKHVSGDQLAAVLQVANPAAFLTAGAVDEAKVAKLLSGMFGLPPGPSHQDAGQYRQPPAQPGPGERGAVEAAKRFGTASAQTGYTTPNGYSAAQAAVTPATKPYPGASSGGTNGAAGAAEAARRFGGK